MKRKRNFLITTLMAAGFVGEDTKATPIVPDLRMSDADKAMTKRLQLKQKYYLAGHRSHSSHRSHGSHRSSSGGGYVTRTPAKPPSANSTSRTPLLNPYPRSDSTAPSSILPSAPTARSKTLPGNSDKFKKIVMQVQLAMNAFGYYNGTIDGIIGTQSKAALALMQKDFNLKVTGTVTPELLFVLGISTD